MNKTPNQRIVKKLSVELEIDYEDIEEGETTRKILLKNFQLSPDGTDGVLSAYCYLTEEDRQFCISKITRLTDLDTDEEVEDIFYFLEEEYEYSPEAQIEAIYSNYSDVMNILIYVGTLNGKLDKRAKDLIADWASTRFDVLPVTREAAKEPGPQVLLNAISDYIQKIIPINKAQFEEALERVSKKNWVGKYEHSDLQNYSSEILGFPEREVFTQEEAEILTLIRKATRNRDGC